MEAPKPPHCFILDVQGSPTDWTSDILRGFTTLGIGPDFFRCVWIMWKLTDFAAHGTRSLLDCMEMDFAKSSDIGVKQSAGILHIAYKEVKIYASW